MKRRAFISGLGCAAATWPAAARAQQPVMPAIGFLSSQSAETNLDLVRAFRQALRVTGHIEGENLAIEYRWAENQIDRLPMLVADLVRRRVAVIAVVGGLANRGGVIVAAIFFALVNPLLEGLAAHTGWSDFYGGHKFYI